MRLSSLFRKHSSERQLLELYRASEQGLPLPQATLEASRQFEADQHLIDQLSELASSVSPADAALQRGELLSRLAKERKGRQEESLPMLRLLNKRAIAVAGAALILVGAAATVGAAGGVSNVAGNVENVLDALQIIDRTPDVADGDNDAIEQPDVAGGSPDGHGPPDGVGPDAKDEVCHAPPDNLDNAHTISVPENALQEHLDHGDSEGACADDGPPGPPDGVGPFAKVDVCHVPDDNPDNAHTISVPEGVLEEHLAHGDSEGAC